jgi:hypothetical protein
MEIYSLFHSHGSGARQTSWLPPHFAEPLRVEDKNFCMWFMFFINRIPKISGRRSESGKRKISNLETAFHAGLLTLLERSDNQACGKSIFAYF